VTPEKPRLRKSSPSKPATTAGSETPRTKAGRVKASRLKFIEDGGKRLGSIWLTKEAVAALKVLQTPYRPKDAPAVKKTKSSKNPLVPATTIICELLIQAANRRK